MDSLAKIIKKIDQVPFIYLLIADLILALFVGLAHTGGLIIAIIQKSDMLDFMKTVAAISLPIISLIILTSLIAFVFKKQRRNMLIFHGILLLGASLATICWAISLIIFGIPATNFSWSPGLMSLFCAYPFFLLRITLLSKLIEKKFWIQYLHIIVFGLCLVVDGGVLVRFVIDFPRIKKEIIRKGQQQHKILNQSGNLKIWNKKQEK